MSTTVVQDTVLDPSNNPVAGALVRVTLIASATNANQPGYGPGGTIVVPETVVADAAGHWSLPLIPNSQITPTNTFYLVSEAGKLSPIVVPATGGPYTVGAILVSPPPTPATPGITGVQVALVGTVVASRPQLNLIAGANITLTVADDPTDNRVDVTIGATGGGGVPTSRQIIAGTGLTGGGDLTADRTLAVAYGTSSTTAARGDLAAPKANPTFTGTVTTARHVDAAVTLLDAPTIATDASLGNTFDVTLTASRALGVPTNPVDNQHAIWRITQDATGGRTLTLTVGVAGGFLFGTDLTAVVLSTTPNTTDLLGAIYVSALARWLIVAFVRGYQ